MKPAVTLCAKMGGLAGLVSLNASHHHQFYSSSCFWAMKSCVVVWLCIFVILKYGYGWGLIDNYGEYELSAFC